MDSNIRKITLQMPLGTGEVNCYLIKAGDDFVLVDTGISMNRRELVRQLEIAGCTPGKLKLILITHGDFDHTGNAAWLREMHHCPIAIHPGDAGMVERGDMFVGRKQPNVIVRKLVPLFTGFGPKERFTPDVMAEDGQDLAAYGLKGMVVSIPGHSQGSIGLLLENGEFFCGDLLESTKIPSFNSIMDDIPQGKESLTLIKSMQIKLVYPGHGRPFSLGELIE